METKPNQLDLNELIENNRYQLSIHSAETISEQEARLSILKTTATYERRRDSCLHLVEGTAVITVVGLCAWLIIKGPTSSDEVKWAIATLSAVTADFLGFLTGKLVKPLQS
jgi:hypothetical protein